MQQLNAPSVRWEWISEAWNLFTKQWSVWVLMILVMALIVFLVEMIIYLPIAGMVAMSASTFPEDGEIPTASVFPVGLLLLYPVIFLAIATLMSWLAGGLYNAAFKQLRGEAIGVGDLFSGRAVFRANARSVFANYNTHPHRAIPFRHPGFDCLRTGLSDVPDDR